MKSYEAPTIMRVDLKLSVPIAACSYYTYTHTANQTADYNPELGACTVLQEYKELIWTSPSGS